MVDLPPIKGRQPIGALIYYHCQACGAPDGTRLYLAGFDGCTRDVLLTDEGAIYIPREGFLPSYDGTGYVLTREVGRIPCPDDGDRSQQGDHVLYDWEFECRPSGR